jgi:very-short-patch-repair endonuclease
LIDLAADVDDSELDRALNEASALKLLRDGDLDGALKRAGNRRGVGRLRTLLRAEGEFGYTRSAAERRMRKVIADARLPRPIANAPLEGFVVDFLWPQFKLVVEVDSYAFHGHRGAFERDRRKDMVLLAAGFLVVRVTWRQLVHEPIAVAAVLASAITARRAHS